MPEEFRNIFSIEATNNTGKDNLFNSGVFILIKGRHIEKDDDVYEETLESVKGIKHIIIVSCLSIYGVNTLIFNYISDIMILNIEIGGI